MHDVNDVFIDDVNDRKGGKINKIVSSVFVLNQN